MTYRHLSLQDMEKLMTASQIQFFRTMPLDEARPKAIRHLKKEGYKTVEMAVKAIETLKLLE